MKNLGNLLKQAQEMQTKMAEMQAELERLEVTGSSGGGMVSVTLNGKGDMRGLKVDPSLLEPGEAEILEDLIIAAHNDARTKVDALLAERTKSLTGGLNLPPGLTLPF